jgi:hypothetical protein
VLSNWSKKGLILGLPYGRLQSTCRRSSVVEHTLGKGEVESPILSDGTSILTSYGWQARLETVRAGWWPNDPHYYLYNSPKRSLDLTHQQKEAPMKKITLIAIVGLIAMPSVGFSMNAPEEALNQDEVDRLEALFASGREEAKIRHEACILSFPKNAAFRRVNENDGMPSVLQSTKDDSFYVERLPNRRPLSKSQDN